ncbi:MAG: hypothetical protein AAGA20_10330 [Planctomycetota bacterium]
MQRLRGATRIHADARWGIAWIVLLVVLQVVGPRTSDEIHDLVWVVVLTALVRATVARHLIQPFEFFDRLTRAFDDLRARYEACVPRLGVDLRGDPPIPAGLPKPFVGAAALVVVLIVLLAVRPFPSDVEIVEAARRYAYAPYIVGIAAYWGLLLFLVLAGVFLPFSALRSALRGRRPQSGLALRDAPPSASLALLVVMAIVVAAVPSRVALAWVFIAIALDLALIWLPGQGHLDVLWRRADGRGPFRSIDWRTLGSIEPALLLAALGLPLIVPDPWIPIADDWSIAPVTRGFHWAATWGAAFLASVTLVVRADSATRAALRPPSRPVRPRVHLEAFDASLVREVEPVLTSDGWHVVRRGARLADDVVLRLIRGGEGEDPAMIPLGDPVPAGLVAHPELRWRLKRRADVRSRRNVLRGLETIFRHAARADRSVGTGFILGPHHWFLAGLERDIATRDTSSDASHLGHLQPDYRSVMTRRARHHLWSILSAVGVDLIHIEYGVSFRTLKVVLRVVFEVYDVHGGERQVEERDFAGVHAVHVVVHEIDLERPRMSQLYPEPEFEQSSRARILHLYKDRGGEESPVDVPSWSDGLPLQL